MMYAPNNEAVCENDDDAFYLFSSNVEIANAKEKNYPDTQKTKASKRMCGGGENPCK
jgi:hypothetical protein